MFTSRGATPVLFPPPRGMTPVPFLSPPVQFVRTPRGMKPAQFTDYNWPTSSLHQDARILTPQVLLVQQVSLPQRGFPQTGAVQPTAVDFTMAARPLLSLEDFCSTLPGGGAPSNNPLGSSQGNLMHALSYAAFASTLPPPPGDAQYIMQSHINQLPQIQAGHAFTHHTFMPQAPEAHFPLLQFGTSQCFYGLAETSDMVGPAISNGIQNMTSNKNLNKEPMTNMSLNSQRHISTDASTDDIVQPKIRLWIKATVGKSCVFVNTHIRTYMHTNCMCADMQTHTCKNKHKQRYIRTYIRTYIHAYVYTYIYAYTRTCIHAHIHTYIHTPTQHANVHIYIQTDKQTDIQTDRQIDR